MPVTWLKQQATLIVLDRSELFCPQVMVAPDVAMACLLFGTAAHLCYNKRLMRSLDVLRKHQRATFGETAGATAR